MTRQWMRSPRGRVLGVATGLAEWRDLPAEPVRLIVFFTILFTGFFPGAIIYLVLALFLPMQGAGDYAPGGARGSSFRNDSGAHPYANATDAEFTDASSAKSTEELKTEYEELKRKVEAMEREMFDKEREWDDKFNAGDAK